MISSFTGDYRWLSNFWPVIVRLDGDEYPSVEHAYQAAKTLDREARKRFQSIMVKAGDAKRMGRKLVLRPDWNARKMEIMLYLLRQKFEQEPLRTKLLATKDHDLVEGNHWHDYYWGVCNGKGQNHLGKLLMRVRTEYE